MKGDPAPHPVQWVCDRYKSGELEIRPPYQRKPVWSAKQRCSLVETLLLDLPIPEIFVQQQVLSTGVAKYAVVDGQQRVRTLLQFVGIDTDNSDVNNFSLDRLEPRSAFYAVAFKDLTDEQRRAFYSYKLSVRLLETDDEEAVRGVFRRLNRYLSPLKPQELRNATYSGPFAQLANRLADEEFWNRWRILTPASIRRMGDIEFVAELLIGAWHGPQAGSASVVDEYYALYEDYVDEFPHQRQMDALYHASLGLAEQVLKQIGDDGRWANKTDFYSLFVAAAHLFRGEPSRAASLSQQRIKQAASALATFGDRVNARLRDESTKVDRTVVEYTRAVEKGANDKARRSARHVALLRLLEPILNPKG